MATKIISLLSVSSILLLSACSNEKIESTKGKETSSHNTLIENIASDMPTLDPQQSSDSTSGRVIADLYEGLDEYNQQSEIVPAAASHWTVSKDGLTYVFYLREKAKWTNGDSVTAADFVYSYRRAVTPATITKAYGNYFNPIVNAVAIQAGTKAADTLGVKAISKYILQIKLSNPNPTFIESLTLDAFKPVNEKAILANKKSWSNRPSTIITNGPYKLTEWIHDGYAVATKYPGYWNAKNVAIEKVKYLMINDTSSDLQNYSSGHESMTYDSLPANSNDWYLHSFPRQYFSTSSLTQEFYIFNLRNTKFKDIRVRKALSMVVDRDGITKGALKQGQIPSYLIVPENISEGRYKDLAKEIPSLNWVGQSMDVRITEARKLITAAGYTPEHPLKLTINFNTSDINRNLALMIQAMWNQYFAGAVEVTVYNEDWKVYLNDLVTGNFDIARLGWIADFNAPNTFTENYTCTGGSNYGKYCNKKADALYQQSIKTRDKEKFYRLQKEVIMMQSSNYSTIPIFIKSNNRLVQNYVSGLDPVHNVMGKHQTNQLSLKLA